MRGRRVLDGSASERRRRTAYLPTASESAEEMGLEDALVVR